MKIWNKSQSNVLPLQQAKKITKQAVEQEFAKIQVEELKEKVNKYNEDLVQFVNDNEDKYPEYQVFQYPLTKSDRIRQGYYWKFRKIQQVTITRYEWEYKLKTKSDLFDLEQTCETNWVKYLEAVKINLGTTLEIPFEQRISYSSYQNIVGTKTYSEGRYHSEQLPIWQTVVYKTIQDAVLAAEQYFGRSIPVNIKSVQTSIRKKGKSR